MRVSCAPTLTALLVSSPPSSLPRPAIHAVSRCGLISAREGEPLTDLNDELKVKFDRDMGGDTKTSFAPTAPRKTATVEAEPLSQNEVLLAEIRALQPKEKPPAPPAKAPVDVRKLYQTRHPLPIHAF